MENIQEVKWKIIKNNLSNGVIEYQVSDGDVGKRTISYDFDNIVDAENCLWNLYSYGENND